MNNSEFNSLTVNELIGALKNKNYKVFEDDSKNYNLNIVGIRTSSNIVNTFNDYLVVFWKFKGVWNMRKYFITTDPGLYWLNNPMNSLGTAILKEGQYLGSHKLGLHQGKYKALVQKKPVTVIRDFDRDSNLDYDSGREETGFFGINIHNSGSVLSIYVNRWSAGCNVHEDPYAYKEFIQTCENSKEIWGNSFTYTLIKDSDI